MNLNMFGNVFIGNILSIMMEIKRKKNLPKIRIEHNKKLFWWIIILLIALIFLIYSIVRGSG